jgi:hypothetical protein
MNTEEVWVTNKNGFTFDVDDPVDFFIDFDTDDVLFGSFSLNNTTGAGSETDLTGIEFRFDDNNGNELEPEYGLGVFNWTYGALAGEVQKKSITVSLSPAAYHAEVNDYHGITTSFSVSGGGSSAGLTTFGAGEPFYKWW